MSKLLGRRQQLLARLTWWWTFRDAHACDISLAGSGGRVFLELHRVVREGAPAFRPEGNRVCGEPDV